ncbi:hypothetical protein CEXT_445131 [Caerostris extrusa]|uniref:Uncharacterized protein n=1 Tax=Caerostris extrusa TaxID=172846 RepID=A0AAV4UHR0_CAEEX|nr:hypothetical protein CEXT_445131 [Caerostris extrusa]
MATIFQRISFTTFPAFEKCPVLCDKFLSIKRKEGGMHCQDDILEEGKLGFNAGATHNHIKEAVSTPP